MGGIASRVLSIAGLSLAVLLASPNAGATGDGPSGDIIRTWNEVALNTARVKNASDAHAARLYAMVHVAMYDAVNGIYSKRGFIDRKHALVPPTGAPAFGNPIAAAAAAAHAVLMGVYPDQGAVYDAQLAADLAALQYPSLVLLGRLWGANVGSDVLAARANDGSSPNEVQPAGAGPGQFRAAWSGVQFRNLAPFAIADSSVYTGAGPPALDSLDYAAALAEVQLTGNAAIPDAAKLATYNYWALGGGTSQPAGWWLQATREASLSRNTDLEDTARLFALVSMGLADSVAPTYMTKFTYRFWRPTTAIREADTDGNPNTIQDPAWSARAGTVGGSPEYWSGHSSFSAVAAAILAGFFCDDAISVTLASDSVPGDVRSYASFSEAAAEAGRSRVFGGIHFEPDGNQGGLAAGRAIAAEVLKTALLLKKGPTHFGACPR
jgi:hypothetical protein